MHVVRVQSHHAAVVVHRQIGVVVLRIGDERQCVHERDRLVVIGKVVGLLDGDVGAVAAEAPALQFGEVCYYFCSCQGAADQRGPVFFFNMVVMGEQGFACAPAVLWRVDASSKTSRRPGLE